MDNLAAVYDFVILIVSVSVFSTGFLSVRIHAALDRATDRAEALDAHMRENPPSSSLSLSSHVRAAVQRVRDIAEPDIVNRLTVLGNAALLLILLLLWGVIGWKSEWHFTLCLSEVAAGFWGLLAAAVVESGIVSLGFFENRFIATRAREFLEHSVAERYINAECAFSRSNYGNRESAKKAINDACAIYQSLLHDIKEWPYVHAQVGYCKIREALLSQGDCSTSTGSAWNEAAISFRESCCRAPECTEWKMAFAQVLIKLEELDDAKKELEELEPNKTLGIDSLVIVKTNLAAIEAIGGRIDNAKCIIESCFDETGKVSEALCHNMSVIYTHQGQDEEAQRCRKFAAKLKELDEERDEVCWMRTKDSPYRSNPGWRQIGVSIQQPQSASEYQFHFQEVLGGFAKTHSVRDLESHIAASESWLGLMLLGRFGRPTSAP